MKNKIKKVIYKLIRLSGVPALLRIFIQGGKPTVLLFHELPVDVFQSTIKYLDKKYNIIDPCLLVDAIKKGDFDKLPKRSLVVTFDDGRRSNLKLDTRMVQAPIVNFISTHKSRLDGNKFISFNEINELSEKFIVGGHSHTHPDLSTLSEEENFKEIEENLNILLSHMNTGIDYFAYPYGKYNIHSIKAVKRLGYKAAFTVNEGYVEIQDGPFEIKRICISNNPTLDELIVKCSGFLSYSRYFFHLKNNRGSL